MILRELGKFLAASIRNEDIACRYGGEEFILIMPNASLEVVKKRAEMIREGITTIGMNYQGARLQDVRVSAGISMFPANGLSMEEVIKAADSALYKVKESGRDRTVVATNPVADGDDNNSEGYRLAG